MTIGEIANDGTIRCDKCKYYYYELIIYPKKHSNPGMNPTDYLDIQCLHPDLRWPDRDQDGEEFLSPEPDFFCAKWEPMVNG